jgi:hypothetical protein
MIKSEAAILAYFAGGRAAGVGSYLIGRLFDRE